MEYLGEPKSIREWIEHKDEFPSDGCLHVKSDQLTISMNTLAWPEYFNPDDFSQNDYDQFDQWLSENNYRPFLSKEQIEGVIENLKQQKPKYSENRLLQALVCYWGTDAFIQL
ncbi:DUF7716 domain-containing protein [Sessilibacter corallicola]|uniref:DUF7716 domain-containing protein n=1 Tax=Sessilibacter corallicola TaxID=2904075 RepID=A0ABQ0AFA2_9GAMM